MADASTGWQLGRRIAPPRFVLFSVLFAGGLGIAIPALGWQRGIMTAFDIAASVFLVSVSVLFGRGRAEQMRAASAANDANRALLLMLTVVTVAAILVAVASELQGKTNAVTIALVLATLVLAWAFSTTVYAIHYAHRYYADSEDGEGDRGGLDFPDCDQPDYWDFVYFSVTLGMAFATSDVQITSRAMRRIATGHCLLAFVFNLGVIAFTVGVLGGG